MRGYLLLLALLACACWPLRAQVPSGDYLLEVWDPQQLLYDMTGDYCTQLQGLEACYSIQLQPDGSVAGTGAILGEFFIFQFNVPFAVEGRVIERGGVPHLTLELRGEGTVGFDDGEELFSQRVRVLARLSLALNEATRTLEGEGSVAVTIEGQATQRRQSSFSIPLPEEVDGQWQLAVHLTHDAKGKPSGEVALVLPNRAVPVVLTGKGKTNRRAQTTTLNLRGPKAPGQRATLRLVLSQRSGSPQIQQLKGKVLGQRLR